MRSLKVCGKRLVLSADDLLFPGLIGFGLRLIWLALCTLFLLTSFGFVLDLCDDDGVYEANDSYYYVAGLAVTLCVSVLYAAIARTASLGI